MGIPTTSWDYGEKVHDTIETLTELVKLQFCNLTSDTDVTLWMDLIRTCRHPQRFWEIDYIRPRFELNAINEKIRQSEIILYGNKRNLQLKDGYTADIFQEVVFHTIRGRLRQEEGEFKLSVEIFNELLEEWLIRIPRIRQSNLLVHACITFLCCNLWNESFEALQKHWAITKYTNARERDLEGIWDNEIILRQIYWFFMNHSNAFRNFYAAKLYISPSSDLWNHKKIALLNCLYYDDTWVVSFCSLSLYNHAKSLISGLPAYSPKPTTPLNFSNTIYKSSENRVMNPVQQKYRDEFLRLSKGPQTASVCNSEANNYLFSYYSYRDEDSDYIGDARNTNCLFTLISFADNKRDQPLSIMDTATSILDAGCGLSFGFLRRGGIRGKYVGVDIAEQVCNTLKELDITCVHKDINEYLEQTSEKFELILCSRLLPHLTEIEIDQFLRHCSCHCHYIAIALDTVDDIRKDIGIEVNLHKTVKDADWWKNKIDEYFDCSYKETPPYFYAYGTTKNN